MATEAQVYDWDSAIELAIQTVFETAGLVAVKPGDDPAFQKERPRVELQFVSGPATGHLQAITLDGSPDQLVHDAYTGQLLLAVFTDATYATHVAYRAQVRATMSRVIYLTTLDYHEIMDVTPNGTSAVLNPEEAVYESRLNYTLAINVKADAWPAT